MHSLLAGVVGAAGVAAVGPAAAPATPPALDGAAPGALGAGVGAVVPALLLAVDILETARLVPAEESTQIWGVMCRVLRLESGHLSSFPPVIFVTSSSSYKSKNSIKSFYHHRQKSVFTPTSSFSKSVMPSFARKLSKFSRERIFGPSAAAALAGLSGSGFSGNCSGLSLVNLTGLGRLASAAASDSTATAAIGSLLFSAAGEASAAASFATADGVGVFSLSVLTWFSLLSSLAWLSAKRESLLLVISPTGAWAPCSSRGTAGNLKVEEEGSFEDGVVGLAANGDLAGFEAEPIPPGGPGGWAGRGNRNPSSFFTGVTKGVDSG